MTEALLIVSVFFFLFVSVWIVSVVLSSSSLIFFFAVSNLLLIPLSEIFLSTQWIFLPLEFLWVLFYIFNFSSHYISFTYLKVFIIAILISLLIPLFLSFWGPFQLTDFLSKLWVTFCCFLCLVIFVECWIL